MGKVLIELSNGSILQVEGNLGSIEKELSDAARSGQSRLAWFEEPETGQSVGVNPDHVALLRSSEPR